MYKDKYQSKLLSIFNSSGSGPLDGWVVERGYGSVRPAQDPELRTGVLDLRSPNVASTHISSPPPPHTSLGVGLRCVTLLLKHLDLPFSFEIQVIDDDDMRRRFRFSTYNRETKLTTFVTSMGLPLVPGWNIVQLDLAQFTSRAYNSMYLETLKVTVHANCLLRRIFFSDKLYQDSDLPPDFRLAPRGRPPAPERRVETQLEATESKLEERAGTKLEGKTETKLEEKTETRTETKLEGKTGTKLEEKTETRTGTKLEGKTETKLEEKTETKVEERTGSKLEDDSETKPEEETETKLEPKTETKMEERTGAKVEGKTETKLEEKTETKVEERMGSKLEDETETKPEEELETKVEEKTETKVEGENEANPEERTGSKLEGEEEIVEG